MKKFLFLLALAMSCDRITPIDDIKIYRCENDEIICYTYDNFYGGSISCKFKEDNVKK